MTRDPRPADAVGLRLEIAAADRDRLLIAAAHAGKSMASYARAVILDHLERTQAPEKKSKKKTE